MVVTVVLTGVPRYVPLVDLAYTLDKFLCSDDIGSFRTRELPRHRSGKRQVALDFKNGFDAMSAQNILSGYRYQLADDEREYILSAKITKDPDLMRSPDRSSRRRTPEPPSYSKALVAYGPPPERTHEELDDQIETLRKQLIIVEKQTKLEKAKKKLKKAKKLKNPDTDSSDSESKSRHSSRHERRHKRRRKRRSTSSQSSSVSPSRRPSRRSKKARSKTPVEESLSLSISPEPATKRLGLPGPHDHRSKRRTSRPKSRSISQSPGPSRKSISPSPTEKRRSRLKEKRSYEKRQKSSSVTVVSDSSSISDQEDDKSPEINRNISPKPGPSKRKSRWDVCETPPPEKRLKRSVKKSNDDREISLERGRRVQNKKIERDKCDRRSSIEQDKGDKKPCKKSERCDSFEMILLSDLKMLIESPSEDKQNKSPEKDSHRRSKRLLTPQKSPISLSSSSDRHVSPYDRRRRSRDAPRRRRDSPRRRRRRDSSRDSPRRRRRRDSSRDSPRRRHESPYRRRDSSRRSRSSPKPSSSRYDATAKYLEHYDTSYFSKLDSRRYSQSELVYVSRCKQTYSQRALPSATVIELNDEDVDRLDEILDDPKMEELNEVVEALTEAKTPESDSELEERPESPPVNRINLEIKVRCTKKDTKDVEKGIDEDRDFINSIRLGKIPEIKRAKTMPQPIMLDSFGAVKKEKPDPEMEQDIEKKKEKKRIRKLLPKPIIEDTKMIKRELYDINEIIQIDDNDVIRQEKIIPPNPKFVLPVIKITKQMKPHTDKVDSSMSEKLLGILRKILRLRIKLLLTDITYYMPSSAITALYRESFSKEEDSDLVNSVITDMNEGKFDDFEPSDDEYDCKSGERKDDNANIIPYIAGKKRKINDETETLSAVIKKSPRDDDVLILEKNIDLIDLSAKEEGKVNSTLSATKSSTDMPPEVAHVDDSEIKKEITDIEIKQEFDLSEINIEDFNMQLEKEVNIANVTNEPEKQINTQQPTGINVKTETDEVISIVKTETITNDPPVTEEAIADIERSQDVNKTIENIVKPDPDASPKMTENTEQNKLDSFVQNVKDELELVNQRKENHEKTKTQSSSKNTDEKISNKPKDTNKPLSKTKHASSKNSDTSKKHEDVAKKISLTVKEKHKKKKSKSGEQDENGDRTKTDAGTKETSEATDLQTDKENPEQQNIVKEEKVEQDECVETIQDFVSLVTNVVVID